MLKQISIHNYALFEDVHLVLGPNFNVFTGETGAGKSLLVGAIGLLLGGKADTVLIRSGCSQTEVTGLLAIAPDNHEAHNWLRDCEISEAEEGQLSVRRILKSNGRSSCYIEHVPVSRSKLAEFMALLFDLHSQHQNQSLFSSRQQLRLLDYHAGLNQLVVQFASDFQSLSQKKAALASARAAAQQQAAERDYLERATREIAALQIQEGEENELGQRIELLSHAEAIGSQLEQFVAGGKRVLELLGQGEQQLEGLQDKLASIAALLPRLQSAAIELEDILDSCKAEQRNLSYSPSELQELDQRLSKLILLSRKYGQPSVDETLRFAQEAEAKLAELESCEEAIADLEQELQLAEGKLMQDAQQLSRRRKEYAAILQQSIEQNLHHLGMAQARFRIELAHSRNENAQILCRSYGIDNIAFLLAANPGEDLHTIQQVASGGEISRIMLAIKSRLAARRGGGPEGSGATAEASSIETIIFDEIDLGIGGETGIQLAQHIRQLGREKQVLCVTHLASIAASASTHIKIEKSFCLDTTKVTIAPLSAAERPSELARMLSGETNPRSLAHAEELLRRYIVETK